jgi:hypothetical protein
MNVLKPIDHLQPSPPESNVVVRGYEDGYNDILHLNQHS